MSWRSSSVVQHLPQKTQILAQNETGMLSSFRTDALARNLVRLLSRFTRRTMNQVIGGNAKSKQHEFKFWDLLQPTAERNPHIVLIKGTVKGVLEKPTVMEPLAMYLTVCKVLDWLYASQEHATPIARPIAQERFPRTDDFYFDRSWDQMANLSELLADLTSCIARSVNMDWEDEVGVGSGKDVAVSSRIVAGILKCHGAKEVQNPLCNFLTASLQLNLLQKGDIDDHEISNCLSKHVVVADLFVKFGDPAKKDKLYGPLSAAVLIDPVFLFMPNIIADNSPCLQEYLIACKALGSERPPLIEAVNMALFRVIRGVADGSIKPRDLAQALLEILQGEDLQKIYQAKDLNEWYAAKGLITRFNGNRRNSAPQLWESYPKGSTAAKRKRPQAEAEDVTAKKSKVKKNSKAGANGGAASSSSSNPESVPADVPIAGPERPVLADKPAAAFEGQASGVSAPAAAASALPTPRSSPEPPPKKARRSYGLPKRCLQKLLRLRPIQDYAAFDKTRRHPKFAGKALSIADRDGVLKECKPVLSNAESRYFWNARAQDISVSPERQVDVFARVDYASFMQADLPKRESHLSQSVLLRNQPGTAQSMSLEQALATCGAMDSPRVVHDLCLPIGDSYNNKQRLITLNELSKIAHDPDDFRALNVLDIPILSGDAHMTFDLVRQAWTSTSHLSFFSKDVFPQGHFTWQLAATTGAMHGMHVDAEGLGTEINVLVGEKVWGVVYDARQILPSTLLQEARPLETFGATLPAGYAVAAVRLTAGTRFFLPPGVIHFVLTTESSVCTGGHMYAWGTMRQTLWSLIHVRIRDQSTNAAHGVWSESLVRIMAYFHHQYVLGNGPQNPYLPRLETSDDWHNLCALFVIMELLNVLSAETYKCSVALQTRIDLFSADRKGKSSVRSYAEIKKALDADLSAERKHDVNRLSEYQRMVFILGRGLAEHSIDSLVNEATGRAFRDDLFVPMMASTIFHLVQGLELSVKSRVDPFWQSLDVRQLFAEQVGAVLERHSDVKDAYDILTQEHFDWTKADMSEQYDIPEGGYQLQRGDYTDDDVLRKGVSARDVLWTEYLEMRNVEEYEEVTESDGQEEA